MKRLAIIVLALMAVVSCGKERLTAEQTVVECWTRIGAGDYQGAVALMEGSEEEKAEYVMRLEEKYAAKLQKAGGVSRVDVLASLSEEKNEALVQAIVVLGNGAELEEVYALKRVDKEWIMGAYRAE